MQPGAQSDYTDLFDTVGRWANAASHVSVFKTSTQFLGQGSDAALKRMFASLRQHHIALAFEALIQPKPPGCGRTVEGYAAPNTIRDVVARIKRLGGELSYVAMDEPLWFGHHYSGPQACRATIAAIAHDVAGQLAVIHQYFPAAQLGDIEPYAVHNQPVDWLDEINQWLHAYQVATGQKLAFFDTDTDWHQDWRPQYLALAQLLHTQSIQFGIIYDGDPDDPTGVAWTRHAEERFVAVEADPALVPDQAILQTWMRHPAHMLPETQPGTMTWLVNRYAAAQTRIAVQRQGDRFSGQLTTAAGQPIPNATLLVSAIDTQGALPPAVRTLAGTVPAGAAQAAVVLRINAECDCSGPADATIGAFSYRDDATGQERALHFGAPPGHPAPGGIRYQANAGQALTAGTQRFPVTPGDAFTLRIRLRATLTSAKSGYLAVIFLDGHKELARERLPLEPSEIPVGRLQTGPYGRFSFLPNPAVLQAQPQFQFSFAGTAAYRLATATVH